jgi:Alginate lyase
MRNDRHHPFIEADTALENIVKTPTVKYLTISVAFSLANAFVPSGCSWAAAPVNAADDNSSQKAPLNSPLTTSATPSNFKHPGVLVDIARLNYVKGQINAGVEPFTSAYEAAKTSSLGSLSYRVQGPPSNHLIECGSGSVPDHGCSIEDSDASAAYTQALLWFISGNATYAKNAITIMNTYARNLTGGHTDSNAPLQSAWTAEKWPAAAEIIRYTYTGWAASDIAAFQKMLTTQYLPYINNNQGAGKNGNWELSMIDGMLGIAIFNDDKTLYASTLTLWKKWVPAYFYNHAADGNEPVKFSGSPSNWNGQTVFNAATSGVSQETCRDTQHAQLGLAATINAAETAYIQGTDLYTPMQARLSTALEYHARMLQGVRNTSQTDTVAVPSGFPGLCDGSYIPVLKGTMERAYNAYHNRLGVALPQTLKHLVNDVRPKAVPDDMHDVILETLTHGGSPAN